MRTLSISKLVLDAGTQPREALDESVIQDYMERMLDGDEFPPIDAVFDGAHHYPYDGFHRIEALKRSGQEKVKANVQAGTSDDAIWLSLAANQKHGQRRTNADKQRAVRTAILKWPDKKHRDIARHIGVSHTTVSAYYTKMVENGEIPEETPMPNESNNEQKIIIADSPPGNFATVQTTRNSDESNPFMESLDSPIEPEPEPEVPARHQYEGEYTRDTPEEAEERQNLDQFGQVVPERLKEIKANGSRHVGAAASHLAQASVTIEKVSQNPAGCHIDMLEVKAGLAQAQAALLKKHAYFYAVCPYCLGDGVSCSPQSVCGGHGWVTEAQWNTIPDQCKPHKNPVGRPRKEQA